MTWWNHIDCFIAWEKGQKLVWDVTYDDTLAESYLSETSVTGRAAAELVWKWKQDKLIYIKIKLSHYVCKAPWVWEKENKTNK